MNEHVEVKLASHAGVYLDMIRGWLKSGATIRAHDLDGPILEMMPDGSMIGGLHVEIPHSGTITRITTATPPSLCVSVANT